MSSRPPDANPPLRESDPMFNFTEGALEAYPQGANSVSYPNPEWLALYMLLQEFGPSHDGTNAAQPQESLVHLGNASQFPPPEAAQPADLATDVQVIEALECGTSPGEALPVCDVCGRRFGRPQELKRHSDQVHMPPRKCPIEFCTYKWKRPDKIKAHITEVHSSEFCPEILQGIRTLRGKDVVKFVDDYEFGCNFEIAEPYVLLSHHLLAPPGESGPYLRCLERIDVVSSEGVLVEQMVEEATE